MRHNENVCGGDIYKRATGFPPSCCSDSACWNAAMTKSFTPAWTQQQQQSMQQRCSNCESVRNESGGGEGAGDEINGVVPRLTIVSCLMPLISNSRSLSLYCEKSIPDMFSTDTCNSNSNSNIDTMLIGLIISLGKKGSLAIKNERIVIKPTLQGHHLQGQESNAPARTGRSRQGCRRC